MKRLLIFLFLISMTAVYSNIFEDVKNNNLTALKEYVQEGGDLNTVNEDFSSLLAVAVTHGHYDLVAWMLKNGAAIDNPESYAFPLSEAIESGSLKMIRLLLDHGADTERSDLVATPALIHAVRDKSPQIVSLLIEYGADVNGSAHFPVTPLREAVTKGSLDIVKILLVHKADPEGHSKEELPPVMEAVVRNQKEILELLIAHGVSVKIKGIDNSNLLHLAAMGYSLDMVPLLVKKGVDVNGVNNSGATPLLNAMDRNLYHMTELLVEKGARFDIKNRGKYLEAAVRNDWLDYVHELKPKKEEINSLLLTASEYNSLKVTEFLLKKGGDVNITDTFGNTPLMNAAKNKNLSMVETLLKSGADLMVRNNEKQTLLHLAAEVNKSFNMICLSYSGWSNMKDYNEEYLLYYIFIKPVQEKGITPIGFFSTELERLKSIPEEELKNKIKKIIDDGENLTQLFIKKGADLSAEDSEGKTPLFYSLGDYTGLTEILLQAGADPHHKDIYGKTALDYAREKEFEKSIELLEKAEPEA